MKNCGFSVEAAKRIEQGYHSLYQISTLRLNEKLDQASKQGYLDVAFGLRVRTPLLAKYGLTMSHSQAEGRSVGNAWGQSYGLLNTRAALAFNAHARRSQRPIYPCAQIHDAQYYLSPRDPELIHWMNHTLTQEMRWQEIEEIKHPQVGLSGELDLFRFSWSKGHTLKNDASIADVQKVLNP